MKLNDSDSYRLLKKHGIETAGFGLAKNTDEK